MRLILLPFLLLFLLFSSGCSTGSSSDSETSSSAESSSGGSSGSTTSTSRNAENEPYYDQHWHLHVNSYLTSTYSVSSEASINIDDAWSITKGENITVAVIDTGIANNHADLTLYKQYNAYTGVADSSPIYGTDDYEHGTAVAGIINAQVNGIGGVGVAPSANLIAINDGIGNGGSFSSTIIESFNFANEQGADIINNSWGTGNVLDSVRDKINDLATNGRNGKGIIIVFSAGNSGTSIGDDESALDTVIGVGATNKNNLRSYYSNYGEELDIMAPGGSTLGIFTTDIPGNTGYVNNEYITIDSSNRFAGTSAAAPVVSGVIALMLSANPNLTRAQVMEILKDTSDKIGNFTYVDGHNNFYGYGKIDAGAAVAAAYGY